MSNTCSNCHGSKYIDDNSDEGFSVCQQCNGRGYMKQKLSNEKLDEITLKIGELLSSKDVCVKFNEDLNCLRATLVDFCTEWLDFEVESNASIRYVIWTDLRKKFGVSDPFEKK